MGKEVNFYDILGISIFASDQEIRNAYLNKIKIYHPDTYKGNKLEAQNMTETINEAYSTLKNPSLKFVYDKKYGFDTKRTEIQNERNKAQKKAQRKEKKYQKKHPFTSTGEYATEKKQKAEQEKQKKENAQNNDTTSEVKTNVFTKKPQKNVKQVKHIVLTPEQKALRKERIILDTIIITLLIIVILLLIF